MGANSYLLFYGIKMNPSPRCTEFDTKKFDQKWAKSAMIAKAFTGQLGVIRKWNGFKSKNFWTAIIGPERKLPVPWGRSGE